MTKLEELRLQQIKKFAESIESLDLGRHPGMRMLVRCFFDLLCLVDRQRVEHQLTLQAIELDQGLDYRARLEGRVHRLSVGFWTSRR